MQSSQVQFYFSSVGHNWYVLLKCGIPAQNLSVPAHVTVAVSNAVFLFPCQNLLPVLLEIACCHLNHCQCTADVKVGDV